jgi:GAF domain-containing protein
MRSSLALASEQDPQVLMATLLRVLCQYTRADFAAIALADSEDTSTFRLVASGAYERIATRDLSLTDDEAHKHCPANLMIKVALTGKVCCMMCPDKFFADWYSRLRKSHRPLSLRANGLIAIMEINGQEPPCASLSRLKGDLQE